MALKTFNVDAQIYKQFSEHCKKEGLSMSRKVENFIKEEVMKIKLGSVNVLPDEKLKNSQKKQGEHPLSKYC